MSESEASEKFERVPNIKLKDRSAYLKAPDGADKRHRRDYIVSESGFSTPFGMVIDLK